MNGLVTTGLFHMEQNKILNTKESQEQLITKFTYREAERLGLEKLLCRGGISAELEARLRALYAQGYFLVDYPEPQAGSVLKLKFACPLCGATLTKFSNAQFKSTRLRCECTKAPDYYSLMWRFNSMKQRCEKSNHVASYNYQGRGILLRFRNLQHFVTWVRKSFGGTNLQGLDFDRINNDGHYSPENIRLISRAENLRNTRTSAWSFRVQAEKFLSEHPEVTMKVTTVRNLLQLGKSVAEIVSYYEEHKHLTRAYTSENSARAKAKKFMTAHPEVGFAEQTIIKSFRTLKETESEILDRWEKSCANPKSSSLFSRARQFMEANKDVGYTFNTVVDMFRNGKKEEDLLDTWKRKQVRGNVSQIVRDYLKTVDLRISPTHVRCLYDRGIPLDQITRDYRRTNSSPSLTAAVSP